jgi:DNA-nicking Smr family endonuclease
MAECEIHLPEVRLPELPDRRLSDIEADQLFRQAMQDVIPLDGRKKTVTPSAAQRPCQPACEDPDAEALQRLKRLVETGEGFVLKHTAEYVEGSAGWMPPELFRRLHRGCFSIQGHVDLHGLNMAAAKDALDAFLKQSIATGKRTVLVVHGRGRSSPGPPVIKRCLYLWLVSGRWKRWVIAFTSARSCDGGTGATYVLLRSRSK